MYIFIIFYASVLSIPIFSCLKMSMTFWGIAKEEQCDLSQLCQEERFKKNAIALMTLELKGAIFA